MTDKFEKNKISIITSIIVSIGALAVFLVQSTFIESALMMILIGIFIIFPYRKMNLFASRMLILFALLLFFWMVNILGATLLPFIISFLLAYILDPVISALDRHKFPRWLSSSLVVLAIVGLVTSIAVFVFPSVFEQLDDLVKSVSTYVEQARRYVESDKFYRKLASFGLPKSTMRELIREELLPKIQNIASTIFGSLLSVLNSLSGVLTQLVNAIIIPVLSFYLLKDFGKLKAYLKSLVGAKDQKLLGDLQRINGMLKKYIGWQVLAAVIVAVFSSISYSAFGLPYPIVLGIISGLLNPIPYLSIIISSLIGILTVILVNDGNITTQIIVILATVNGLHFINAYLLEPNIAGKQVGLHPVMLILSLFVFGGLFGFIGLLIAVPLTAILMMFFYDWVSKLQKNISDSKPLEQEV